MSGKKKSGSSKRTPVGVDLEIERQMLKNGTFFIPFTGFDPDTKILSNKLFGD